MLSWWTSHQVGVGSREISILTDRAVNLRTVFSIRMSIVDELRSVSTRWRSQRQVSDTTGGVATTVAAKDTICDISMLYYSLGTRNGQKHFIRKGSMPGGLAERAERAEGQSGKKRVSSNHWRKRRQEWEEFEKHYI